MVGIGWRQPHYQQLLELLPAVDFVEVHSENFFAPGGASLQLLKACREQYPVSLHGVGLSLGSACGLDRWHLDRLAGLVELVQPLCVSDHASFSRIHAGDAAIHGNDLLPIPFSSACLDLMASHVQQVQDRLGRQILVENISAYLAWDDCEQMTEPEFFNQLTRRSGCGLLLDVNNLIVNARNQGADRDAAMRQACEWIDQLRSDCVGEIHLAGHAELPGIVIDDHGSKVPDLVWQVYAHALKTCGAVPSLIEWDTAIPALEDLLAEAHKARLLQVAG